MTLRSSLLVLGIAGALIVASASAEVGAGVVVVAGSGNGAGQHAQVAAHSTPAGTGGHFEISSGGQFNTVEVRCIRVLADRTLVGGVIVKSWNPEVIGRTGLIAVSDGGPAGTDEINVAFSISGMDQCPVFALPLAPVVSGNFVVR